MLTAAEARELSGRTLDEKLEALGERIKSFIEENKAQGRTVRELRTGWDYKEDRSLWIEGGYETSDEWYEAKKKLEQLGYKVQFNYYEGQFVDMYTSISW